MTVSTMDGLVAALTGGETRSFLKASMTAEGAGTWQSLWTAAGYPGAGAAPANPTTGVVPTDATAGAFPFTNAVNPANNYLGYIAAAAGVVGTLIVYDRLWHLSGLSGTSVAAQNITHPGLSRYTSGDGVELWGEIYAAPGATANTMTVSYTDQAGNAGNSATYAHPANAESVGQMFPFTLAAGDSGVRSVASFTNSVSTGTAGDIGLTMLKRIVTIPLPLVNVAVAMDAFSSGLREIVDDACLAMMVQCSTTSTGTINGELTIAKG